MWHLSLSVCSRSQLDTQSLCAALATDCPTAWIDDDSFEFNLTESKCKDLRAMWNTRMRGLIATDEVLKVFAKHS
ncbi:hypothetical protein N9M83_06205 [Candidatus Poseidonia alphae]|nr:hypothetical protein [Candidatus Poseidonia alphae]MDA8748720.1 hypothetical protein [Candidatus Poseidonia alphae]MDA8759807.1 hypothetical protein [Candidatus Poseidonia alphae]MDB2335916.1 hypothetical protein [Candidatus Poseidonia alphae]MDC0625854.1 hypothetical protein [Candidatus Poseidonia alphae]